jgi:rod shape-determining protein MreD
MSVVPRDVELGVGAFRRAGLLVITLLLLHVALLSQIRIFGVRPETLQLLTVVTAVQAGSQMGAGTGVLAGLAADLIAATPFGYGAVSLGLVGYGVGFARDHAFAGSERYSWPLVMLGCLAATALMGALVLASDPAGSGYRLSRLGVTIAVSAVMNMVMLAPMQWLVRRVIHGV